MSERPLVVVENTRAGFDAAVARARGALWRVVEDFGPLRTPRERVVRVGEVAGEADAALAVLAAVRGQGVIAFSVASRAVIDRLLDDLARIGPVSHLTEADEVELPLLTREERALLLLLGQGLSLGEAARRLHVSRRTADRRLASARCALGVSSTSEAVLEAGALMWSADAGGAL